MSNQFIIKTTTGESNFVMEEKFKAEEEGFENAEPVSTEVKNVEIKIQNIKWKKINE